MIYGYARVSSKEQSLARQIHSLKSAGVAEENIFKDKHTGKDFGRKAYTELISKLKENDLLIVKSIDRFGRNYSQIIQEWYNITKIIKADIKVLDMSLLDTSIHKDLFGTFISDVFLQLLSFISENERNFIKQRQKEGIDISQKLGVKFGRPKKPLPENFEQIVEQWQKNAISTKTALKELSMPKSTFYRKIKEIYKN